MKILYGAKMVFTRSAIAYNSAERQCLFYSPVVWGGGESDTGGVTFGGLGAVPPAGSRGRAPGQGAWGEVPQKLRAFRCTST